MEATEQYNVGIDRIDHMLWHLYECGLQGNTCLDLMMIDWIWWINRSKMTMTPKMHWEFVANLWWIHMKMAISFWCCSSPLDNHIFLYHTFARCKHTATQREWMIVERERCDMKTINHISCHEFFDQWHNVMLNSKTNTNNTLYTQHRNGNQ